MKPQVICFCAQCRSMVAGYKTNEENKQHNVTCPKCGCIDIIYNKMVYDNPEEYRKLRKSNQLDSYFDELITEHYQNKQNEPEVIQSQNASYNNPNPVPKCPTCGSTNIRRINGTEKAFNAAMFGLLGNKRKCQFECQNPNCRYRW